MPFRALTIAGTDSSGGAGVGADLKTFTAHEVWGTCAVTAVTAQNAEGVHAIEVTPPDIVAAQIRAIGDVGAAKTGMLATARTVEAVLGALPPDVPLVVDPVLRATTGEVLSVMSPALIARATVVTPNREEALTLTGAADPVDAARQLVRMGADIAMVTGSESARDVVVTAFGDLLSLDGVYVDAPNSHGTGCILSAAIAAEIAKGMEPLDACIAAKHFVARALADGFPFF